MITVKNLTISVVFALLGYATAFIQFKGLPNNYQAEQQTPGFAYKSMDNPHQMKSRENRNKLENLDFVTTESTCGRIPTRQVLNKRKVRPKSVSEKHLDKDIYPVYSTTDYAVEIEKNIVPEATQVMLMIQENEVADLLEIIETEEQDSEWGYQYEDQISNFIAGNDANRNTNITQIVCKTNYCQLEVTFDDEKIWMALYQTMSKQPWWNSIAYRFPTESANAHSVILHRLGREQLYDRGSSFGTRENENLLESAR